MRKQTQLEIKYKKRYEEYLALHALIQKLDEVSSQRRDFQAKLKSLSQKRTELLREITERDRVNNKKWL